MTKITPAEQLGKKAMEYDFEAVMKHYEEGGTPDNKVTRTWGLVISWLVEKKKFPLEVVGAAILITMERINKEGHFKGIGDKYGSKGREFDRNLAATCEMINNQKLTNEAFKSIAEARAPYMQLFISKQTFSLFPWWVKMLSWKYWKYRKWSKKHGAA